MVEEKKDQDGIRAAQNNAPQSAEEILAGSGNTIMTSYRLLV
jgi:hypothetical protein